MWRRDHMKRTKIFMGAKSANGSRDYGSALIDASVTAGFTFFSALGASAIAGSLKTACLIAGIAAGISFFGSLMVSLQIKKPAPQ
jgi:hypothetical protein